MNILIEHGWKYIVALGGICSVYKLFSKLNSEDAKEVLIHAIDACKELAVTSNS